MPLFSAIVTPVTLLTEWLSTRSTGLCIDANDGGICAVGPDFRLRTERNVEEGETLFEILHNGLLTPAAAYNDKEVGLEFKSWAQRIGPGFGTVALASYVAIDRVRGFRAGQWFAGSQDISVDSEWSPLTRAHWALAEARPSRIDEDLIGAVQQGIELVLPLVETSARRAGRGVGGGMDGEEEGWSRGEVIQVLEASFALVLDRQFASPPPELGGGGGGDPSRWGFEETAPEGPALLPPLVGVLLGEEGGGGEAANAMIGRPKTPKAGSLGAGVGLRCVATRDLVKGEVVRTSE